jgi:AraC-like DNA-binding protein
MDVQPHLLNLSAYINQNLEKDLPLSSLAKRVGLSPFHFHRKFGAYFGESLHQHIKRLRLERAAYALTHQSTPVRQIARDSGYKTVSAFSHAFSGFAGESPTRYRSQAIAQRDDEVDASDTIEPSWVGELAPQAFAFVRAKGNGVGTRDSIREAIELITTRVGQLPPRGPESDSSDDDRFPFIVATSDFYGVAQNASFRLDVGLDASRVPPERAASLGMQTLPGGPHARFDFHCTPDEILDRCRLAATNGLKSTKRTARLSQYFLRFGAQERNGDADDAPRDYRFFIPLAG